MAGVDRLLKNLPYGEPPPSVGSAPTVRNTPAVAPPGADLTAAGQWLGTWARVVLGLLIGIGMTQWPYTHGCGLRRSEEHTSELQSQSNLVCRLLLEKKKKTRL